MTTMAMAERNEVLVRAHLALMSDQLQNSNAEAEGWAWPLIPANLKRLYVGCWGDPSAFR